MKLPFLKDNSKDKEKRALHRAIQQEALRISGLVLRNRLRNVDVDKMERLYETYHKKYPDKKAQLHAKDRIAKLRTFTK